MHTMLAFFLLLTNNEPAFCQTSAALADMDSVEISLLTCGPRPSVYSLYGHTAIRYRDFKRGTDLAVNYGMFSFSKPYFVLRFVFGLTDYEMGIEYFDDFASHYAPSGCGVRQQVLNLTPSEKLAIVEAIDRNYQPENRVYRYNYFYDNCTTRARDILVSHIQGKVNYQGAAVEGLTFRKMIHQYNETHRWARFGNDMLLGVKADMSTSRSEQQFLPEHLAEDFAHATITTPNGAVRQLVTSDTWILPHVNGVGSDGIPVSPLVCMVLIALVVVAATGIEMASGANLWWLDMLLMLVCGVCGLILLAMVFSQHPTVSLNLQILLLNPLALVAVYPATKALRKRRVSMWTILLTVCLILMLAGSLVQSYAEGMGFVALSLLLRNTYKIYKSRKQ